MWHLGQQVTLQKFRVYSRGVKYLAVRPGSDQIITAGWGPHLQVWRFEPRPLAGRFPGHQAPTYGFAARADGRRIATSDSDGTIRVWDPHRGTVLWKAPEPTVWQLAFVGDDLLSITSRGAVRRWSRDGQSQLLRDDARARRGSHVDITSAGTNAAWTAAHKSVVIYDAVNDTQRVIDDLPFTGQSSAVALSHDGDVLAAADENGHLVVRSFTERFRPWTSSDHHGIITGLSFRPNDDMLASSGEDGIIRLWRVRDGTALGTLTGHADWINRVAFSPDGRWLLSGSDDRSARLWNIDKRRPVLSVDARAQINALGFIPGRNQFVVGRDEQFLSLPISIDALDKPADQLCEDAQLSSGLVLDGFELAATGQ